MPSQTSNTPSRKSTLIVIIAAFVLVAVLCKFDASAAQGCNLLEGQGWVALAVLRPIFLAGLRYLHLLEDSVFFAYLSQIVSSVGPFFSGLAALV